MKDLLVVRKYTHKGIDVLVKIDFVKGRASLVEQTSPKTAEFKNKKWLFSERETGYIKSWLVILDAMKHAMQEALKELEAWEKVQLEEAAKREAEIAKHLKDNPF